jgi:hypothetical protein
MLLVSAGGEVRQDNNQRLVETPANHEA